MKKFVISEIEDGLSSKNVLTDKNDLWIVDEESKEWFLQADSFGQLYFNKYYFQSVRDVFSLTENEFSSIIKEWFQNNFEIVIRSVSRKPNNLEWAVNKVVKTQNGLSELNNRNGFTFGFAKKYIFLKKNKGKVLVEDYLVPVIA